MADREQAGTRFAVYELNNGLGIWDSKLDRRHQQPGFPDSHWWPASARPRAQAWVDREAPAPRARIR